MQALFEKAYFEWFRVDLETISANLVNLNCSVPGVRPQIGLSALIDADGRRKTSEEAQTGTRPVWFDDGWRETRVFWRDHLPAGAGLRGPAIIEQMDTTIVVEPGNTMDQDSDGNLIIDIGDAP